MTSEREIWEAALLLIRSHGDEAAKVAAGEATRHGRGGDRLACVVWSWVARAAAELIKSEPGLREHVH